MKKQVLSAIIMGLILCTVTVPVLAEPTSQMTELQGKSAEYEKEKNKISAEISKLNSEAEPLIEKTKKNDEEVKKIQKEIDELDKEIDSSKEKIKEKEKVLSKRIRELYKSGGVSSYMSVISKSESFDDFLVKLDITNRIINIDKDMVDEVSKEQKNIKTKIQVLEKKKSETKKMNLDTERNLKQIENKKSEQQKLIDKQNEALARLDENELGPLEITYIQGQLNIIDDPNSSYNEIELAIQALSGMVSTGEIISKTAVNTANSYIEKGQGILSEKDKASVSASSGEGLVNASYLYLGTPYVWGATGPDSFDCSGFTSYVYRVHAGIEITRTTYSQMGQGVAVSYDELIPGDLVFTYGGDHVGIYVGGGSYIHAPQPGDVVRVSPVQGFYCARRIL